ncbi:Zinc finger PHD-finger [Penicillium paradoxum]|uniref:Zinc finger PHD-finger n=1 Tax=Penicillium paradoxum TaxID=176176 RepID=UPI002548DFFC|nr:Zinc finger PHD-finger [Penicillium paradoxum]KAJ5774513.1 Zinc finger PHD-finger [Penicillium paradoxum]
MTMRVSAALMDLPAPEINPVHPQNIHEGDIFDHKGISDLPRHPELMANNLPWESRQNPAQLEEEAGWANSRITEMIQQSAGAELASNRTRSGRRVNQPAVPDANSMTTNGLAAPVKAKTKKRKRQTRQVNIICTGCYRGNSPSNNFIVLCDTCDAPWHQKCHSPNIENEVIEIPEMQWFCIKCKPAQRQPSQTKSQKKAAVIGQKAGRPKKHPVSTQEVGGNYYSEEERRAYLSSLSHDALVQLILKVSNKWPSVPMFPPNMEPVTDFTPSLPAAPHNQRTSNPALNTISDSAFIERANISLNPYAMDSTTTAPESTGPEAHQLLTELLSESAPIPSLPEPLGDLNTHQELTATSHGYPATIAPMSSVATALQHPSETVLKSTSQAANTAQPARKASLVSWNSDLLTDDESSYSQSRPQSLTPFASRSSQIGSYHGSEFDAEDYRAYPEPGQGFRVPSTPSDLDILAEDKDCPTFSHSIRAVKKAQNKKPLSPLGQRKKGL